MHESTRKRVCRWAFFTLCLAPTIATGSWIGTGYLPMHDARIERALSQRLHVKAHLAPCDTPKPGVVRTASLSLSSVGSEHAFINLAKLQLYQGSSTRLAADELHLAANDLMRLASQTKLWLANDYGDFSVNVRTATIELGHGKPDLKLSDVRIQLRQKPDGVSQLQLVAQLASASSANPKQSQLDKQKHSVALTAERQRDGTMLVTLDAERASIPAQLLVGAQPLLSYLEEGSFRGAVQWHIAGDNYTGVLRGRLSELDFSALFPADCRYHTSGATTIEIEELRFDQHRIARIEGSLSVKQGEVSRAFLQQAQQHLACVWVHPQSNLPRTAEVVGVNEKFDRLACHFQFDEVGLTLAGDFSPEDRLKKEAKLMVRDNKPLLMHPPSLQYPAAHWVKFVTGDAATTLPATEAAIQLARRLPARREPSKPKFLEESIEPATLRLLR